MKVLRIGSWLGAVGLLFAACKKNDNVSPQLTAGSSHISATAPAGKTSLSITSNTSWKLSGLPEWLTATPGEGSGNATVELSYSANTALEARLATFTLSGANVSASSIAFTQLGAAPTLLSDKTTLLEKGAGQQDSIVITANVAWQLNLPTAATWITASKTSGPAGSTKVFFTIAPHTAAEVRSVVVELKSLGATLPPVALTFEQAAGELRINQFTPHAKGGASIVINGNGFSATTANNIVTINGVAATVTAANATALTVTVPAKAGSGVIKVAVGTKSFTSTASFIYDWVWAVSTLAGGGTTDLFGSPAGIVRAKNGALYIADTDNNRIRKIIENANGTITLSTFAGSDARLAGTTDGVGTDARFARPVGLALDAAENLWVADMSNSRVRKVDPAGKVTTLVHPANGAILSISYPRGVAVDAQGNVYVTDYTNKAVRKVFTDGAMDYYASGLNFPFGLLFDKNNNLLLSDLASQKMYTLRKATETRADILFLAGSGVTGNVDGAATEAQFHTPTAMSLDSQGNIYLTDTDNHSVRCISTGADGTVSVTTIAGDGTPGSQDGEGKAARFNAPIGVAVTGDGATLYVADQKNNSIRKITRQ